MTDTDKAIQVLARLTNVGDAWPIGAWIYIKETDYWDAAWFRVKEREGYVVKKLGKQMSELEANAQGIFRPQPKENES